MNRQEKLDKLAKEGRLRIALCSPQDKIKKIFNDLPEATKYCLENMICNSGWPGRSLERNEKFYQPNGNDSISHNGYTGYGWYLKYVVKK